MTICYFLSVNTEIDKNKIVLKRTLFDYKENNKIALKSQHEYFKSSRIIIGRVFWILNFEESYRLMFSFEWAIVYYFLTSDDFLYENSMNQLNYLYICSLFVQCRI